MHFEDVPKRRFKTETDIWGREQTFDCGHYFDQGRAGVARKTHTGPKKEDRRGELRSNFVKKPSII